MGVPKFFRYMSERYPCLSELIKEYEIPEFDNMYLDMNGIIHVCSHPNDSNPHFRITEEKIFEDIFKYIEVLFRLIQPKQLFFMAVDGVAPRAKMNHQRGRRFRSAKDAETAESLAVSKGEKLPEEKRFDSNCITPGTEFMVKLQKQLQLFVNRKITQDKMWRKVKIILSGHECPGEGEHKIMDYIRFMKSQPDYNPNTRHCIYGLDADLIMLGLCTHEPYFSLLREEVKFGKQNNMRCMSAEEINFYLLHLSVMRDYLDLEFQELKETLPFPYDLECVINDWVLMGFLVGNDFIPHLPNFHIANGALPVLYNAYKSVLPTLDGYLNEEGTLNLKRFEAFLKKLSEYDEEAFREKSADLKWLDGKRTRALKPFDADELDEDSPDVFDDPELAALVKAADEFDDEEMDENAIFDAEFYADKKDYYLSKMGIEMNEESIKHQAAVYVGAIQWNLHYYYDGCCSWSWYYPYHYAPYVSDVTNFSSLELKFDLSVPFLPFEQLLAVLPPASKTLLPAPYQRLMTEETSPIIEYYPEDFGTDLNGKKQDWEAVVLLPFIDEKSLKAAMRFCESELSVDERKRNSHGPMYIYTYSKEGSERPSDYNGPLQPRVKVEMKRRDEILVEKSKLVKGICKGINLGAFMFGFPNLRHVKFNASLEKAKVMVFEQPSRNENMILNVEKPQQIPLKDIADKVVNQIIFVDWPFLAPAKVSQIMTEDEKYYLESNGKICMQKMTKADVEAMKLCIHTVENRYKNKKGINVGSTDILVFAHRLIGQKRVFTKQGLVSFEREFDSNGSYYVHQVLVNDVASSNEFGKAHYKSLGEVFMPNSECFMLGHPHYGSLGKVVEVSKTGRVKIDVVVNGDPNLENARKNSDNLKNSYMKPHQAAARLSISTLLLSRITGTILVVKPSSEDGGDERIAKSFESKVNIGLNLKLTKRNEVVPGYVRKSFNGWVYSPKAVDLIVTYMRKFPSIFEQLNKNEGNDIYKMNDLFPDAQDQTEQLKLVTDWLKSEPFSSIPRMSCNSEFLETEIITDIYNSVNDFQSSKQKKKSVVLEVKPHLLYQPVEKLDVKLPDPSAEFHLFDRVVCIRESFSVPLGLKGTITGIQRDKADCETKDSLIIVLFDKDFVDDESLDPLSRRSHRVHAQGLINISHGDRIGNKNTVSKPISVADKMEGSWRQNSSQSAFAAVDSQTSNTPQNTHNKSRGGFYDNTGPRYPNNDSFRNNSYHNAPPQTGEMFFKNSKNVSRTDKTYTPKMVTEFFKQPTEKASTVTSNKSDFQGMWQELKKAGNTKSPASPAMDPSNALKKMLQIADAPKALTTLRPESHSLVNPGQTSKSSPVNPMKQVFINSAYQHHQMPPNFMQNMQSLPIQSIPMQSMPIQSMPVQSLPMQSNHGFRNQGPFGFQPKVSDSNPRNGHIANSPLRPPSFPTNFPPPPQIAPLQVAFGKNAPIAPAVVPNFPPPPRMEQSKPADAGPLAAFSNPFVPLQVTRKQVTNIGNTEGSSGTFQITEQSAGQNSKSSNGMINPLVANPSTSNPEVSKPRRSRIAAKFAAPLDSKN